MSTIGATILDGGSHVCQVAMQWVCELSIGALEGGVHSSSFIYAQDGNYGMVTQISHFASRLLGGVRGLKTVQHLPRISRDALDKVATPNIVSRGRST